MHLSKEEYERRLNKVLEILGKNDLEAGLIYYDELNMANGWYLSGWCPQFESGSVLVCKSGRGYILGGPESEPFARMDSTIKETRNIPVFMVPEEEYPGAKISSFQEIFEEALGTKEIKSIGIAGLERMPYGVYRELQQELKGAEFVDITHQFEDLRVIKSPWEIETIKQAFKIADESFKAIREEVKEGIPEYIPAAVAEKVARSLGANGFGFQTIIASGERSNGVVPVASEKRMQKGQIVLAGVGPRYHGYSSAAGCSMVVGGKLSREQQQYFHDVATAFRITKEQLKPGNMGRAIDKAPREYLKKKGYGSYQLVPYVHTIGLNEADRPFFGPNSKDVLEANMTVCIDVSLFGHPGLYGIRMETGYLITEDGAEPLSGYMENMILQYAS